MRPRSAVVVAGRNSFSRAGIEVVEVELNLFFCPQMRITEPSRSRARLCLDKCSVRMLLYITFYQEDVFLVCIFCCLV